jgi:hypothetical protein
MRIGHIAKAIVAGLSAGAAAAAAAVQDGTLTPAEDITIVLALLGAWGITWAVPNRQSADA